MPHVIYLHSALTQRRIVGRNQRGAAAHPAASRRSTSCIAMSLAGCVNLAMMIMAASLFHGGGFAGIDTIQGAFHGLQKTVSRQRRDDLRRRADRVGLRLVLGRDDGRARS